MNINQVENDGFLLNNTHERIQDVSFISLRISLKAYFNTFKDVNWSVSKITDNKIEPSEQDKAYGYNYIENACQSITGFHHFVALLSGKSKFRA